MYDTAMAEFGEHFDSFNIEQQLNGG
jgi:hypothetical protein